MAHAVYTTEAIVCGAKDSYTSDKSYLLFTRDAGMLWAKARSVRVEKSKQRFALQEFSIIRVSLIKGKTGWHIGSVEAVSNPFMESGVRYARTSVTAIIKLLRRFMHGEVSHPSIYKDSVLVLSCLMSADQEDCIDLQNQFTIRTLHTLGYIAPDESYNDIINSANPWSVPQKISSQAEQAINNALAVSHL